MTTTTNARLKRALNNGIEISQSQSILDVADELKSLLSVKEAYLRRVYTGTGKSIIELKNTHETVTSYWVYGCNTVDTNITYYPKGRKLFDEQGQQYIQVTGDVLVDCLKISDNYIILGYSNNTNLIGESGDLIINSGQNSITINDACISIVSKNLRVNGLPYEEPCFIDDLAGAEDINDLLDYLTEHLV